MPDQLKSASACIGCLTSAQYDGLTDYVLETILKAHRYHDDNY